MTVPTLSRFANILDYAIGSLRRKMLKNTMVFCVFSLVIFFFASLQLTNRALSFLAAQTLREAPEITVQQMSAGRQTAIASSAKEKLATIAGVIAVTERIWGYYFDEKNGANYTVLGLTTMPTHPSSGSWPGLALGRLPMANERGKVVLSGNIKKLLQLGDRRYFSLFRPDLSMIGLEVVGIFNEASEAATADLILMSLADARDLFAIEEGSVTDLLVRVANPLEVDTVAGKIHETLPGVRVITRNQIIKTYEVAFSWRSGIGILCLITTFCAFIILAWDKASGLSQEDLREVAIEKILGWQTTDLILLRFCESLVVAFSAFFFGFLAAWIHVVFFAGALFRPLFLGWSVLKPSVHLAPPFAGSDILLIMSVSILPYLVATALPAWRTAMAKTDTVL